MFFDTSFDGPTSPGQKGRKFGLSVLILWLCTLMAQRGLALPTNLMNTASSTVTWSAGQVSGAFHEELQDDTTGTSADWNGMSIGDYFTITFNSPQNVGAVMFVVKHTSTNKIRQNMNVYAGIISKPDPSEICGGGIQATTMGTVNCGVSQAQYVHVEWLDSNGIGTVRIHDMYVFESIDIAQLAPASITVKDFWKKGSYNFVTGAAAITEADARAEIESNDAQEPYLWFTLPFIASGIQIVAIHAEATQTWSCVSYDPLNAQSNCSPAVVSPLGISAYYAQASGSVSSFKITETTSGVNIRIKSLAVLLGDVCQIAVSAAYPVARFAPPHDHDVGAGTSTFTVPLPDITYSQCTFGIQSVAIFEADCITAHNGSKIVESSPGILTITETDIGSPNTIYCLVTTLDDAKGTQSTPIELELNLLDVCTSASLLSSPFSLSHTTDWAIASTLSSIPFNYDSTYGIDTQDPMFCGERLYEFQLAATTSLGTQGDTVSFITVSGSQPDAIKFDFDAFYTPAHVGTFTINVIASFAAFPALPSVTAGQISLTIVCPAVTTASGNFQVLSTMSSTSFTHTYTSGSLAITVSNWNVDIGCWTYNSFYVEGRSTDQTSNFTYDKNTMTLTSLGIAAFDDGVTTTFNLWIQVIDASGAVAPGSAPPDLFLLNSFDILMISTPPCDTTVLSTPQSSYSFTSAVDQTQSILISVPNTIADLALNAAQCGDLQTSYIENISAATVSHLTFTDILTATDPINGFYIDLTPPTLGTVNPGDTQSFTFTTELADYVGTVTSITIFADITYECPINGPSLSLSNIQTVDRLLEYNFNLAANPHLFLATSFSLDYESSCFQIDSYPVTQTDGSLNTITFPHGFYDSSNQQFTVQFTDTTGYLDNTFTFKLYVRACEVSNTSVCSNVLFDQMQIVFTDPPDPTIDCPNTVLDPIVITPMTYILGDPASTQLITDISDSKGTLYSDYYFCGSRTYDFEVGALPLTPSYIYSTTVTTASQQVTIEAFTSNFADLGTYTVTLKVGLLDYPSVTPQQTTLSVSIVCPSVPTYTYTVDSYVVTHLFGSGPLTLTVSSVTEPFSEAGYCFTTTSHAEDAATVASEISYDWLNDLVTIDNTDIALVGTTATFNLIIASDVLGNIQTSGLTVTYDSGCDTTTFQAYTFPSTLLSIQDPQITLYMPRPSVSNDFGVWLCGSRTHQVTLATQPTWVTIAQLSPTQVTITVNPSIAPIGSYTIDTNWILDLHPLVNPLSVPITIEIICGYPNYDVQTQMVTTEFSYDILSGAPLEISLPTVIQSNPCVSVTESYITVEGNFFDNVDWDLQTFTLMTDDASQAGSTVEYVWLVKTDVSVQTSEFARFQVTFTSAQVGFEPPLTSIIQVFKQRDSFEWSYPLPSIQGVDELGRTPTLELGLNGASAIGLEFVEGALQLSDISQDALPAGEYSFWVSLSFGDDKAFFNQTVTIMIHAPNKQKVSSPSKVNLEPDDQIEETLDEDVSSAIEFTPVQMQVLTWQELYKKKERKYVRQGELREKQRPTAKMQHIQQDGVVEVTFDQNMRILPDLAMITEGLVQVGKDLFEPCVQVDVVGGSDDNKDKRIDFKWRISAMNERNLVFQLEFEKAREVSMWDEPDVLKIKIRDPYLFIGSNNVAIGAYSDQNIGASHRLLTDQTAENDDNEPLDDYTAMQEGQFLVFERDLPPQIQHDSVDYSVMEAIDDFFAGTKVLVVANFLLNILISATLNQLWAMINTQQLIVMMVLFDINMPANAGIFFRNVMEIAAFDFYDVEDIVHESFGLEGSESIGAQFDALGFQSQYFLVNMGTLVFFFMIYLLQLCIILPVFGLCKDCSEKTTELYERLYSKIRWNSLIRLFNESYMIVVICILINAAILSLETPGIATLSIMCVIVIVITVVLPLTFLFVLCRRFSELGSKTLLAKYGEFYADLNLSTGRLILLQPSFFLVRRYIIAISIVTLSNTLIFQLYGMASQILFQVMIIKANVFTDRRMARIEVFNEFILMNVLYTIFFFSPWVSDVDVKFTIGYVTITIVSLHFITNLFVIFFASSIKLKQTIRLKVTKRKYQKQRTALQARLKENHPKTKSRLAKLHKRRSPRSKQEDEPESKEIIEDCSSVELERSIEQQRSRQSIRATSIDAMTEIERAVADVLNSNLPQRINEDSKRVCPMRDLSPQMPRSPAPRKERRHIPVEEAKEAGWPMQAMDRHPPSYYLGLVTDEAPPVNNVTINISQVFLNDNSSFSKPQQDPQQQRHNRRTPIVSDALRSHLNMRADELRSNHSLEDILRSQEEKNKLPSAASYLNPYSLL